MATLLKSFFLLFVCAPVPAAFLAFKGPPSIWPLARIVLFGSFLAHAAATAACIRYGFAKPDSGIGSQVLLLVAIPFALFTILWFGVWRAARRHAYVQSLPEGERRYEELVDIERALEAAQASLARAERRLETWLLGGDERDRLRDEVELLRSSIRHLQQERAKRR